MSMPKGWMDAETARPLLKRGTWAHRPNGDLWQIKVLDGPEVAPNADLWRYIGPHPDDAFTEEAAEVEALDAVEIVMTALYRAQDLLKEWRGEAKTFNVNVSDEPAALKIADMLIRTGLKPVYKYD